MRFLLIHIILIFSLQSPAATGTFRPVQTNEEPKPWFTMKGEETISKTSRDYKVQFLSGESQEVLSHEEISTTLDGVLISYAYRNNQSDELVDATMEADGLKISYGKISDPKNLKTTSIAIVESEKKNLVVPPLLSQFIVAHWDEALTDNVQMILFAPNRHDTFRFHFKWDKRTENTRDIVLKANSIFVALAVAPIHFEFDQNRVLQRVVGFTPPIKFKDKSGHLSEKKTTIERVP